MPVVIVLAALIFVAAGILYFASRGGEKAAHEPPQAVIEKTGEEMMKKEGEEAMMEKDANGTSMKDEGMTSEGKYSGAVLAGKSAPLLDFKKADYDTALRSGKLIVLYFYANWCPICKVEFPNAQAAFNELTTDKVVGFRVNYKDNQTDSDEEALAREFGVPYQHTKVFLKNGSQVLKAPDSWDTARYLGEISKHL